MVTKKKLYLTTKNLESKIKLHFLKLKMKK